MANSRSKLWSALSLTLFSSLVLGYLWQWRFSYFHRQLVIVVYLGCAGLVLLMHRYRSRREMGLRLDNLGPAAARFGALAAALSLLIAVAGLRYGEWSRPSWKMILPYLGWSLLQQHVLQNFLKTHWGIIAGGSGRLVWLAAAAVFAIYHLPNPWLVLLSFVMAVLWCGVFSKSPNLLAAGIAQTLLTVTLAAFFKFGFLGQFEVGRGGYRFEYYGDGVKVAGGHLESGEPFVATLPGADRHQDSLVRVFSPEGRQHFEWVAFPEFDFSGEIAAGDLGFGPGDEVVVTPGPGPYNPPSARIFSPSGKLLQEVSVPWLPSGYGAWPAVNCNRLYLSAGPGPLHPQRLVELTPQGEVIRKWEFPELGLSNGLRGTRICQPPPGENIDGSRSGDLLLWGTDISSNPATLFRVDPETGSVRPIPYFETTFGLQLTLVQWGQRSLVAGAPGPLRGYSGVISLRELEGGEASRFFTFPAPQACGANLSAVDWDGDGSAEIIVGQGNCPGRPADVQLRSSEGALLSSWRAY